MESMRRTDTLQTGCQANIMAIIIKIVLRFWNVACISYCVKDSYILAIARSHKTYRNSQEFVMTNHTEFRYMPWSSDQTYQSTKDIVLGHYLFASKDQIYVALYPTFTNIRIHLHFISCKTELNHKITNF